MKIADAQKIKHAVPPEPPKTKKTGSKKFDKMLSENLKTTSAAKAKSAKSFNLQRVAPVITPAIEREEVVSRVMKFLDVMDDYAQKLGSPRVTLKEISPLIAKIESEKNDLKELAESLSPMDDMKTLLDEALIRSEVEVIKYNRGDYI